MDHDRGEQLQRFRAHAVSRGVNPILYRLARALLLPFFLLYFRLQRIGTAHIPRSGPLLLAANHRSFLDPFVIGALTRRPVYYVAKRELFARRWQAWLLNALGAFPIDRGAGDADAMATARAILARGDCVVIFPEGTRVRRGPLGPPRRGLGRLALETGARIVPVAISGTADVRRGWRIRPRKVRLRCGAPLTFPIVPDPSLALAATVTARVWARVGLQWEWLGCNEWPRKSLPSPRRSSTRSLPSSTARICATSTATATTASATTTTPRTSPSRPSCRPTATSSAPSASPTGAPCGHG